MRDYGLACVYQSRSQSIRGQQACESHWASTAAGDLPLSLSLSATHPDTTTTVFPLLLSLFKILCCYITAISLQFFNQFCSALLIDNYMKSHVLPCPCHYSLSFPTLLILKIVPVS